MVYCSACILSFTIVEVILSCAIGTWFTRFILDPFTGCSVTSSMSPSNLSPEGTVPFSTFVSVVASSDVWQHFLHEQQAILCNLVGKNSRQNVSWKQFILCYVAVTQYKYD